MKTKGALAPLQTMKLFFLAGFVFLKLEVFVEFGGAVLPFGEKVEADT